MSNLSDDFVEWVREQLQAHKAEVSAELDNLEAKKSLSISVKLKLKNIGGVFKPSYHFSIPRAAVKADAEPNQQLTLPGV